MTKTDKRYINATISTMRIPFGEAYYRECTKRWVLIVRGYILTNHTINAFLKGM